MRPLQTQERLVPFTSCAMWLTTDFTSQRGESAFTQRLFLAFFHSTSKTFPANDTLVTVLCECQRSLPLVVGNRLVKIAKIKLTGPHHFYIRSYLAWSHVLCCIKQACEIWCLVLGTSWCLSDPTWKPYCSHETWHLHRLDFEKSKNILEKEKPDRTYVMKRDKYLLML